VAARNVGAPDKSSFSAAPLGLLGGSTLVIAIAALRNLAIPAPRISLAFALTLILTAVVVIRCVRRKSSQLITTV
jgi:hypothetical protein